jgi:hypothetical protein
VKVKEGSDVEEEDNPVPIRFTEIKAEPEVSCMWWVHTVRYAQKIIMQIRP